MALSAGSAEGGAGNAAASDSAVVGESTEGDAADDAMDASADSEDANSDETVVGTTAALATLVASRYGG